jgi:peptidyl-prolyl cis-trans isomerase SurA
MDPQTGATDLEISKLDPSMILIIDSLKPGEFSHPHIFNTDAGERSCRIVYLLHRTTPHKANLKDDYSKLQDFTLNQKKAAKLHEWIMQKLSSFYMKIEPEYLKGCDVLKQWQDASATAN